MSQYGAIRIASGIWKSEKKKENSKNSENGNNVKKVSEEGDDGKLLFLQIRMK